MTVNGKSFKEREFLLRQEEFDFLAQRIYSISGIVLSEHKKELLYSRLARRIRTLRLNSFSEYIDYLEQEDNQELEAFLNALTTNLTYFFREQNHYDFISRTVIPEIGSKERVRCWSAACSTGEEAFSLAMVLDQKLGSHPDLRILATDINSEVLSKARSGQYSASQFRNSDMERWKSNLAFTREGQVQMSERLRQMIVFNRLNLLGPWPMKKSFQLILCRNVFIYFNRQTQIHLVQRFTSMLDDGGYLIVGNSENLLNMADNLSLAGQSIYRKTGG